MALVKLRDYYADSSDVLDSQHDINHFDVYAQGDDKVGTVNDILVDEEEGRIRYLIVDTGFWVFGKKVLMPIGMAQIDYTDRRINARSLTKEQVENLPDVDDSLQQIDYDYEERVQGIYNPSATRASTNTAVGGSASIAGATPTTSGTPAGTPRAGAPTRTQGVSPTAGRAAVPGNGSNRRSYDYNQQPNLYNTSDRDHQTLKLYEERLVTGKNRHKTGEVAVGKRVETETVQVEVPLRKERLVVERTAGDQQAVDPGAAGNFKSGDAARVELYEETPEVRKETFVSENVQVRKEVDRDVARSNETVRREELDVDTKGNPSVDNRR
ncbi:MAG: DUF2382 domain-containing protein [Kaiparowitsia implicata GSE-PSE-MK54-09C]|nr:DUF2382 domain-containing protein [Kaiparowitsia implicata GSE-PSE-MK54-09C]